MAQGKPCFSDASKSQHIYARSVKPCGRLKVKNLQQSVAHVTDCCIHIDSLVTFQTAAICKDILRSL